ncbi:NUDIX domain-containing protein [Ectobacillus antri]|uniref:NUDIX domain-containing protein n=1 Tax=Ectobacillus antri TaxID=2486280 RepID=A0ABT6H6B3_9BACI|nr:NUDIX domain-containing protein [Ectobacillus antri]MDG4657065.1 NUDIX domain-containing protein [Ectobacillus antri]MDG5754167.1 NUDIX domain-containing protein [Ectobacillus antri]
MKEHLAIFNEQQQKIGTATREEVHRLGHWHETFHCWFLRKEEDEYYITFQMRSSLKQDYPNLLDITAAGHLLAHETVQDGLREVEEELGITLSFEELHSLGVILYNVTTDAFIDREICHVFLYLYEGMPRYELQREEVSGLLEAKFTDFYAFCRGTKEILILSGFLEDTEGIRTEVNMTANKQAFVPHEDTYLLKVASRIAKFIK